jgi:hypothetical protein
MTIKAKVQDDSLLLKIYRKIRESFVRNRQMSVRQNGKDALKMKSYKYPVIRITKC